VALRVFLVGLSSADLDDLAERIRSEGRLVVVGRALLQEIERRQIAVPDAIDAVLMTPQALARNGGTRHGADRSAAPRPIEALTPRELDVVALAADGRSNRDIAGRLGISEHTVKFHLASVFGKLGVSTRTEAVRRALEWQLIHI
jgi:DNA-binding CsgD family transcriptional regulator